MKIVGGHDYYDRAMMYGIDDSVILIRNNRVLEDFIYLPPMSKLPSSNYKIFKRVFVVVADKLYSGIQYCPLSYLEESSYVWSHESYLKLLERVSIEPPRYPGWSYGKKHITPEEYFSVKPSSDFVKDKMISERISILVGQEDFNGSLFWTANVDTLRALEFYKAVDAFTLYQALDMWVSGVLIGSSNNIVEIKDDKIKIQKHGFDLRSSFRKRKSI